MVLLGAVRYIDSRDGGDRFFLLLLVSEKKLFQISHIFLVPCPSQKLPSMKNGHAWTNAGCGFMWSITSRLLLHFIIDIFLSLALSLMSARLEHR